ncbi:MAG TPA: MASE1 domain-containing protein [Pseudolabrys sp.]|nr:MASE1 domain-containing protein [Pseudolabrys sp.]
MHQIAPDNSLPSLQEAGAQLVSTNIIRNVVIVGVAYYIGAQIAFLIGTLSDKIFAPFWPPNIVLFCALLITPPRQWWMYIAAAFPAHTIAELGVGMQAPQLLVAFATNCMVAVANALAVQRLIGEPPWFETISKMIIYVLTTAFLGPAVCALGGAFVQILGGGAIADYGLFWTRWFASNALGSLTLGPIVMSCIESMPRVRQASTGRVLEALVIATLLVATCVVAFQDVLSVTSGYLPMLLYLPLPIIVWAALRFGIKGASGAIFVISVVLLWHSLNDPSPFDIGTPETNVFAMQLFLIGLSLPILLLGSAIEETRRAERTTRESEERISFAAASSNVGLWQYEFATRSFWATEYCRTLFGLHATDLLDLDTLLSRIHPNDSSTAGTALRSAISHGKPLDIEFRVQDGDAFRWIAARARPITSINGRSSAMAGAFGDVTSRKMVEAEADVQRQEIAHLMRVSMLGELAGGLAHELTQPLTAILANAQAGKMLLARGLGRSNRSAIAEIFDDIVAEDGRAGEVIHRLRGMLKKGEIKHETIHMNELIGSTIQLLHSELIDRRMSVRFEKAVDLPTTRGDPVQLQQTLLNLLMNAMDATENVPPERRNIMVSTTKTDDGGVEVRICDSGIGLPPSTEVDVFQPFCTTKERGLGLGLSICTSILKFHGGALSLQNNVREGATALFRLPPPLD